jgi:hypothetical protein
MGIILYIDNRTTDCIASISTNYLPGNYTVMGHGEKVRNGDSGSLVQAEPRLT